MKLKYVIITVHTQEEIAAACGCTRDDVRGALGKIPDLEKSPKPAMRHDDGEDGNPNWKIPIYNVWKNIRVWGVYKRLRFFKSKRNRMQVTNPETVTGAFIEVDENSGRISHVYICGDDDQAVEVVRGALARITRPSCFR